MTIERTPLSYQQNGVLRQAQLKMLDMLGVIDEICVKHGLEYWLDGGTLLGAIRHQGFIPWDDDLDISMPRTSFEQFMRIAPKEIPDTMFLQTAQTDPGFFNLSVPLKIRDRNSRFVECHEQGNEPYVQGIFIDVFVIDKLPRTRLQRVFYKFLAKKILRLLSPKYSKIAVGHGAKWYRKFAYFLPKTGLETLLQMLIRAANKSNSSYLGNGYDCINTSMLRTEDIYPLKRARFETGEFYIANNSEKILRQLFGDFLTLPKESERIMKHCKELIPTLERV